MSPDKLTALVNNDHPGLGIWRIVICTEDSIKEDEVDVALENIAKMLSGMAEGSRICTFIRVRNQRILGRLLELDLVDRLDGFVVPKADPADFTDYADQLHGTNFKLLPIMESDGIRDRHFRDALRAIFDDAAYRNFIDCVRIGGNDLMGQLGIRRPVHTHTIYDTPVGATIHELINEFQGLSGFPVTAPVFECFAPKYDDLFRKEVQQHIANGLFGQTVISPRHLRPLRDMYKVPLADIDSARSVLEHERAVIGKHGRMDEYTTHHQWAKKIIARHHLFGDDETSQTLRDLIG